MEFKTDALVLRAVDYGENDRMVTLLTAARGKIGAGMKGVRRAGAKLRFASQPFCFAEYVFAEKSGRYTVTQASLHDGFYALREDLRALYGAAAVAEGCDALSREGMECGDLLVAAVTALRELCAAEEDASAALVRFFTRAAQTAGYPLTAENCPVCGRKPSGRMYFDFATGAFHCASCAVGVPASESTYRAVRAAQGAKTGERGDGDVRALRLLKAYFSYQVESGLPALDEYLRLL